jgi:thiamine biosynthesis lipoprotein
VKASVILVLLVAALSPAGQVQSPSRVFEYSQVHMGMPVRLLVHARDETAALEAARAAFARIKSLDEMMSDYRPDSGLRRLEGRPGERIAVSKELFEVLRTALDVARITDGAFDPTVGPLVALWRSARRDQRLPDQNAIRRAREIVGWRLIHLDPPDGVRLAAPGMRLDLGGIAKGYILQEALRVLRAHEVTAALVEAGGDVVVGDPPPGKTGWKIATADSNPEFAQRAGSLANSALATSGPSAQFVEVDGIRYSHVVDPRTGLGVTSNRTVRVIARDGAIADAVATALCVTGPAGIVALQAAFPDIAVSIVDPSSVVRRPAFGSRPSAFGESSQCGRRIAAFGSRMAPCSWGPGSDSGSRWAPQS